MFPSNPVAAVCHADPYPYYRSLRVGTGLQFDAELKLWVASSAAVVRQVLEHPACVVRPADEPVPRAIAATSAGQVFGHLVRMNEGRAHSTPKLALAHALASLTPEQIAARTSYFSSLLAQQHGLPTAAGVNAWMFDLPLYVVADLLGFAEAELPQLAIWMGDFVRCLSPLSSAEQLASAGVAAQSLLARFGELLAATSTSENSLVSRIQQEAQQVGWQNQDAILANLIGLLSQTYEATAGLIANSLVALLSQNGLQQQMRDTPEQIAAMLQEVCRYDPPVQNTRRFVVQTCSIAGVELQPGDAILLVLAAASRDESDFPNADEFQLDRPAHTLLGFSHGRHLCPGQTLALGIGTAALQSLLALTTCLDPTQLQWTYRTSLNGRLPLFQQIFPTLTESH
ncbi:cytochrome P450 [Undibacterium sp.]|uniref:cytochrome P450 n=1 Tax=Undibacterium sp. TaxID=1914977 RepID=UPI0025CD4684|nr:cytochrome P450 [Undibacterium sp.]